MVYIPPSREALHEASIKLIKQFNLMSHRYIPPNKDSLLEQVLQLRSLYGQRVAEKPTTFFGTQAVENQVHIEEIECITRLVLELRRTRAGASEEYEVQNIILGALIYRYLAIDYDYTKTFDGKVLSWIGIYNKDTAALYSVLKEILGIREANQLDSLSIVTRCTAYLDWLRFKGARRGSAFIRQEDVNFFDRLQHFIMDAKHASNPVAQEIKSLAMIQSVDNLLCKTGLEMRGGFELLSNALGYFFKAKNELSRDEILSCMKGISSKLSILVISMIDYLLRDDEILRKEALAQFVGEMEKRLATYTQYALLGAYVIVLTKSHSSVTTQLIESALGIISPENLLDDKTRVNALSALEYYLNLPVPIRHEQDDGFLSSLRHDTRQLLSDIREIDFMSASLI